MKKFLIILLNVILMPTFVFASTIDYTNICENSGVRSVMLIVGNIIDVVKWIAPLIIIILGMIDFGKAVTSNDDKAINKATFSVIRRVIAGIVIFFVPTIIGACTKLILEFDVFGEDNEFAKCTNCMFNKDECERAIQQLKEAENAEKEQEKEEYEAEKEQIKQEQESLEEQLGEVIENPNEIVQNLNTSNEPVVKSSNLTINLYNGFSYWLYIPDVVTKNMPIVVYMPGLGERGNDYYSHQEIGIQNGPIHEVKKYNYSYNAIIIHMQVPYNDKVYSYIHDYIKLINLIADKFEADKNRISVMGLSHGCYGIVSLISAYPNYFSSVVPVGCGINKNTDISRFTNQPVWTFVGGGDGTSDYYSREYKASYYSMQNFVNAINNAGGNAKHTSVSSKSNAHNIMSDTYSILRDDEYKVIEWMINQTRK